MVRLKLSNNAVQILEKRYLRKDKEGKVTEKPEDLFKRVAENIAFADAKYLLKEEIDALQQDKEYYEIVKTKAFENLIKKNKVKSKIGSTEAYFASLDDLIKMKSAAGRAKDLEDVKVLEKLKHKLREN